MKEYTIRLSEEKDLTSSTAEDVNQIGMTLQIWQDLVKIKSPHEEDQLVRLVLGQILDQEFGGMDKIPMPDYYKSEYYNQSKEDEH